MTIGDAVSVRLIELMEQKKVTAYRLSMLTGVDQSTIGDIKKRRNIAVNIRTISALCQVLGVGLNAFFDSSLFTLENIED